MKIKIDLNEKEKTSRGKRKEPFKGIGRRVHMWWWSLDTFYLF
jgi:hypothetical protein